jgi:hypothetical protein
MGNCCAPIHNSKRDLQNTKRPPQTQTSQTSTTLPTVQTTQQHGNPQQATTLEDQLKEHKNSMKRTEECIPRQLSSHVDEETKSVQNEQPDTIVTLKNKEEKPAYTPKRVDLHFPNELSEDLIYKLTKDFPLQKPYAQSGDFEKVLSKYRA